jgi:hypothetical protein
VNLVAVVTVLIATTQAVLLANLDNPEIDESSGLAASRHNAGILWTHNDSGDGPFLYAIDRQGRALANFTVAGAEAVDWEDMAAGPDATLYVGDIGDNLRTRDDTAVYRVAEPEVDPSRTDQTGETAPAVRLPFTYPDGPHDAESLLVDLAGAIYVVTKEESGEAGVYQFPTPLTPDETAVLEKIATISLTGAFVFERVVTGGAISPDGTRLVVRTYLAAFEWTIAPGQSLADALAGAPRQIPLPLTRQGESITYSADGPTLLMTSEGVPCPLYEVPVSA